MAPTSTSRHHTFEPRILQETSQLTFAAHSVIEIGPSQQFHILISNVSTKALHLPKQVAVAYATGPSRSVLNASSTLHHRLPNEIPKILDHSASSNEIYAYCEAGHNSALYQAPQAEHDSTYNLVRTVNYESHTGQGSQIEKYL